MTLHEIKGPLWGLPGTVEPDGTVRVDLTKMAQLRAEVVRNLRSGRVRLPPKQKKKREFLDFPTID